ncbi:protocadherin-like wing polarity protein stan [Trichonephila inaurata madagascariensis]|uniref:Protocadherin-like wing polarity protein stan n=1 Tax=Trichonephila inaurata madagascariensis TaxID=2747483 RepID=A0A8X6YYC0_9ARAC|nr:protocadherin-like wing polarity protein stan [Trichonephila inaurata madagascariensis]
MALTCGTLYSNRSRKECISKFIDSTLVQCCSDLITGMASLELKTGLEVLKEDNASEDRILNVSFSAKPSDSRHPETFFSSQYLQERVYLGRAILARLTHVHVLPFEDNLCVREPCINFEQCLSVLKFGNASDFISSDMYFFRSIIPINTFACRCPPGFTGMNHKYECDTEVNLCYSNPCLHGGSCVRREGGFSCICPHGYTGFPTTKKMKGSCLINSSIVLGLRIIGKGFSAGKKLCAFLGLPFLSKLAFRNQERKLLKATERVVQENINAALSEIKGSNSFN